MNFTYRMHDPRVGRFFTPDPLERDYPWYTPYQFSGNKVIQFVELEGLEEAEYNRSQHIGSLLFSFFFSPRPDKQHTPGLILIPKAKWVMGGIAATQSTIMTGGLALELFGTEAVLGYMVEEAGETVFTEFTGIPVIIDPFDFVENLSKQGIKKLRNKVVLHGRDFFSVSRMQDFNKLVKKTGSAKVASVIWDRGNLKKALKIAPNSGKQAHHIIPINLVDNANVKKAINEGFDFNGVINGIPLDETLHKGSHGAYDKMVETIINDAFKKPGNKGKSAKEILEEVSGQLKSTIEEGVKDKVKVNEIFKS